MLTKKAIFMLLIVLSMGTLIHAQSNSTIVFATRPNFIDPDTGESPEMLHIYTLEDEGYEVIQFYNASLSTAEQATLDTLYNANLIIIGRSIPSLDCGNHKEAWNSIPTPILCLEMWAIRNSRLNWLNTTAITNNTEEGVYAYATIDVPDDPVFEGLDTSAPVPWMISPYDVMGVTEAGNGTVLARMELDSTVLFIRWEPDVEFYDGSVDYPAGHRTLIGNGRDNSSAAPFDYYNFTEESEQVFLAEVARLVALGGGSAVKDREKTTTPSTLVLSQNYPNPFNPSTTIQFSLPVRSDVRLILVNLLGKVVEDIATGTYEAGTHQVRFDAFNLSTGVYFYRLEANGFMAVKKLILMK